MTLNVIEKLNTISEVMTDLINFVQTDKDVEPDFQEYLKTIGVKELTPAQSQAVCMPYIFERNINSKNILEIFLEKTKKATKYARTIIKGLTSSVSSIFEVKKILKNGFELYNLVNEKTYSVISLVKMTHFRGIGVGQYVIARIFEFEEEYYLLEISNILAPSQKDDAMRYAIAKIIQAPELVYKDNSQKQKEIEKQVKKLYKKFTECFEAEEIITTNKLADDIMGIFNDYAENNKKPTKEEISSKIQELDEYKFFNVEEFNNSYENFLENSLGGFSSHKETYDVGIIFDEELGLSAVPFYKTFCKIFEAKDYMKVENYDKCVEHFLLTDGISANLIRRVAQKYPKFMKIINKIYSTDMTLEELLEKYKPQYLKEKIYSSTTVLYQSNTFSRTLGYIEDEENKPKFDATTVGRNEPCPCGSGKKYKKCCMMAYS
ncbi:MAG: SEC-C domain-containing protein [Candidatus Gastranaerophilales bacterium]|nr:SEC-C domain-containing protein [Candidatus Gastranaerophilales bacterium]